MKPSDKKFILKARKLIKTTPRAFGGAKPYWEARRKLDYEISERLQAVRDYESHLLSLLYLIDQEGI